MTTRILHPKEVHSDQLQQIITLINTGGQIQAIDLKARLLRAEFIAIREENNIIVCTATLKNPLESYVKNIFKESKALSSLDFNKELGYIATKKEYENMGYCKDLLFSLYPLISNKNIFATTRKASIIHILGKYGFKKIGNLYKNDLNLLVHNGKAS